MKPKPSERSVNNFVHEFNNLLTAIISNLSMAKMDSSPESDLNKTLSEAENAAHEAKQLVKQFFSLEYEMSEENLEKEIQIIQENFFGNRRVLVIDDDERAGAAMCKMLEHLGFKVEYFKESSAAIERYKKTELAFDLVILDLMIPGKKAEDTLKEFSQYDPEVKTIVCSGYLNDPIMRNFQDYGFRAAIRKPYKISELSQVVGQVLSDSSDLENEART